MGVVTFYSRNSLQDSTRERFRVGDILTTILSRFYSHQSILLWNAWIFKVFQDLWQYLWKEAIIVPAYLCRNCLLLVRVGWTEAGLVEIAWFVISIRISTSVRNWYGIPRLPCRQPIFDSIPRRPILNIMYRQTL